jgi:hypothetical protein
MSFASDISVTATVDKNSLTIEDVLRLSIIIQGTQNTPPPELPSLPSFRVATAGTSSSTQYINTQRSVSITHNYRLTPMKTGTIIIGPARIRINGDTYSTKPITIKIQKSSNNSISTGKTAFVEVALSKKEGYIGEQLVYTFRLFHRVDAKNLNLQLPFNSKWFHKENLGEPKSYIKVINGIRYHVQEMSIAIFPLMKGLINIPASTIELDLLYKTQNRNRQDPFSQFFNDPFFGQRTQVQHKILRSQSFAVDVLPLPQGAPKGFKNLIGEFDISAKLGKKDLEVGDTTTLTVTVSGRGDIKGVTIEEPDLKNHFKIYPDKPEVRQIVDQNQMRGEKIFKFALVPLLKGNKTLPPFSLPYFDTKKGQYYIAKTQAITLGIKPSSTKEKLNLVQSSQQSLKTDKPEIQTLGKDILPIYTEPDKFQNNDTYSLAYMGIGFSSPIILFLISVFVMKRQNRMKYDVAFYRRHNAFKNANQRLKDMKTQAESKEFARQLSEILRGYIGDKLNLEGKAITAEEVEAYLKESNYQHSQAKDTRKLLEKCESLQYAPINLGNTKELLGESENLIKILEKQS